MSREDIVKNRDEMIMSFKPRVVKILQNALSKIENANDKNTLLMTLEIMEKTCVAFRQELGK